MTYITDKILPVKKFRDIAPIIHIERSIIACVFETAPLASGLLHFVGWFLSFSISLMSLMIYTADEIRQKLKKNIPAAKSLSVSNIPFAKKVKQK